jgi:hypothetical protein
MKTLKMSGLDNYISPVTKFTTITRDKVLRVDDSDAERMLQGEEWNTTKGIYPHFEVVGDDVRPDYDFTTATVTEVTTAPVAPLVLDTAAFLEESTAETDDPAPAPAVVKGKSQRVARKSASATA